MTETRRKILEAAAEVMLEKGAYQSPISKIAASAGIADSVIYHYFKSKDDLLYYVVADQLRNAANLLEEQLEGIIEPISRISKAIWFHIKYFTRNKGRIRLALSECLSKRSFYQHEAYQVLKEYEDVILIIIKEGKDLGVFRENLDPELARDIVWGTANWIVIQTIVFPDQKDALPSLEETMEAIRSMFEITSRKSKKDKPSAIIDAAEIVFSQKDYGEATIGEIARLAEVAEGTVYEYFKNKEDLLFSIAKKRAEENMYAMDIMSREKTTIEKFRLLICNLYFLLIKRPTFMRMFMMSVTVNPAYFRSEAYKVIRSYYLVLEQIIDEGKQNGSVKANFNNKVLEALFTGGMNYIMFRWFVLESTAGLECLGKLDEISSLIIRALAADQYE